MRFFAIFNLIVIFALSSCGRGDPDGDLLQTEFVPNSVPALMVLGDESDVDERRGRCIFGGLIHIYRYSVMNRQLREHPKLRELAGFNRVTTCAQGYRFIQAKNYFYSEGDGFDGEPIPDEVPAVQNGATTRSDAIMNGVDNNLTWAVRIHTETARFRQGACSASLITDEWLMTSAHCVIDKFGDIVDQFNVWTESANGRESECITTSGDIEPGIPADSDTGPCNGIDVRFSVRVHPEFSGSSDDEDDLALLHLDGGWPNYRGPYPLFARGGYSEDDYISIAGYGPAACNDTGSNNRTRASFVITDVDSKDIEFDGRPDFAVCEGDSGSPAYIVVNGAPLIAGLLSGVRARFSTKPYRECAGKRVCAKDASVGQLTRLWDAKESWIEQQLGFQCYENGGIADCNRRPISRPSRPRPPTEPGGPSRDCPNCQVP